MAAEAKVCAICAQLATIFCEADEAFLCVICDIQIHGMNILAQRYVRKSILGFPTQVSGSTLCFSPSTSSRGKDSPGTTTLEMCDAWRAANVPFQIGNSSAGVNLSWGCGDPGDSSSVLRGETWPSIQQGNQMPKKTARRLTLAPGALELSGQKQAGYQPSTRGGKQLAKMQLESDIKQQLFCSKSDSKIDKSLHDLSAASDRLEASINRMRMVTWGSAMTEQQGELQGMVQKEVEDDVFGGTVDGRFNHSWAPCGPKAGWYWIPKGRLTLDKIYPARPNEVRRFGHNARKVRATSPPAPLSAPFASVAMASRVAPRAKRRSDEWMEEDDLLGGDLMREQDLRRQLQRGPRQQMEGDRFRGRRIEGYGNCNFEQGNRDFDRSRGYYQSRFDDNRLQNQQGSWNQGQQGSWNQGGQNNWIQGGPSNWIRGDRRQGQDMKIDVQRNGMQNEGICPNQPNSDVRCFRCLGSGHLQIDCT